MCRGDLDIHPYIPTSLHEEAHESHLTLLSQSLSLPRRFRRRQPQSETRVKYLREYDGELGIVWTEVRGPQQGRGTRSLHHHHPHTALTRPEKQRKEKC